MRALCALLAVLRFGLRLELGPEFDSNANHAATQPAAGRAGPIESFLLRGGARGRLSWDRKPHALRLSLDLAGKLFFAGDAGPQNAAAVRVTLEERSQLAPRFALGVVAEYHDVLQPQACPLVPGGDPLQPVLLADTSCHRDFRAGGARLTTHLTGERLGLAMDLGLRGYEWKPDEDLTFFAAGGGLSPSLRIAHRAADDDEGEGALVTLQATARGEWRRFAGATDPLAVTGDRREDLVGSLGLQLAYAGPLLASAGWSVEASRSNSALGLYAYHVLSLSVTMALPAKIVAAMRAQRVLLARGAPPTSLAVEDENRDAFTLDLSRELGAGFTARARWSMFRNAASDLGGGYLRQLVFVGASWEMR